MSDERGKEAEATGPSPAGAPAGGALPGGEQTPDQLRAQLEEERRKAQDYLASWQRAAADYQNFKRRVDEERAETARFANASLVINLLPVVDDIERALASIDVNLRGYTWVEGVYLIYRKLVAVLENAGVSEIPADGRDFDPTVHEAISQAEGEEGKVIAVVQKGYKLGDRVVRPALVVVGKGKMEAGSEKRESGEGIGEKEG